MAKVDRGEIIISEIDGHVSLVPVTNGVIGGPAPRPRVGTHCGWMREGSQPAGRLGDIYGRRRGKEEPRELNPRGSDVVVTGKIRRRFGNVLIYAEEHKPERPPETIGVDWPGVRRPRGDHWHDPDRWTKLAKPQRRRDDVWTGWDSVEEPPRHRLTAALVERIRALRALVGPPFPCAAAPLRKAQELETLHPPFCRQTIQELLTKARPEDMMSASRLPPGSPWPHPKEKGCSDGELNYVEEDLIRAMDRCELRGRANPCLSPPSFDCLYPEGGHRPVLLPGFEVLAKPRSKGPKMV
jgi:hypothetical protein